MDGWDLGGHLGALGGAGRELRLHLRLRSNYFVNAFGPHVAIGCAPLSSGTGYFSVRLGLAFGPSPQV